MEESPKKVLDKKSGFGARVNLYIIRYLYYHMKKADKFTEQGKGARKKSIPLENLVSISRQRFDRIFHGSNYQITKNEIQNLANMFNISSEYFQANAELINIYSLSLDDWQVFCGVNEKFFTVNQKEKIRNKVSKELKRLVEKDHILKTYDTSTAIYRIYYYFENGTTFREATPFHKFLENMELIKISDWKEIDNDSDTMSHYLTLLEKHYDYLRSRIRCKELEQMD